MAGRQVIFIKSQSFIVCDFQFKVQIFLTYLYLNFGLVNISSETVDTVEETVETVDTVEDFETDAQNLDQGEEGEEYEGEHEGNPEAKDIVKYYRYLFVYLFQIIIFNHYECYNKHTVTLRHFL